MATKAQFEFEVIYANGKDAIFIKDMDGIASVLSDIENVIAYIKVLHHIKSNNHLIVFSYAGLWHQFDQKRGLIKELNYLTWELAVKFLTENNHHAIHR